MQKSVTRRRGLWRMGFDTIRELETEQGILASGREEIYGCIFGRDSLITALKLLKTYEKTEEVYFLSLVKKILLNLALLQGTTYNIESGEEPGKIIHEYRKERHEHLTGRSEQPWYLYPDKAMRNYDSVDATPLFLITAWHYYRLSQDKEFFQKIFSHVEAAFSWLEATSAGHEHGFISYNFHPERRYGGLVTQSWMDSADSVFHEDGSPTPYPIAPAEVQHYAYLAYRLWQDHFVSAREKADRIKRNFNKYFVSQEHSFTIAFAIDGNGKPMLSPRSSMGHLLWASTGLDSPQSDSILEAVFIPKLVARLMAPDLYEPRAGIRTLSALSSCFDPASYHNGSIWPHDNAIIARGLENFGYLHEAARIRKSLRDAWNHFKSPIELYVYADGNLQEYATPYGQKACSKQAWSAASILALL